MNTNDLRYVYMLIHDLADSFGYDLYACCESLEQ